MRDKVLLKTHVYSPKESSEKLPVILVRTPGPPTFKKRYENFLKWGYTVVIQTLRSSQYPDKHPEPYFADAWGELQDGYDTISWIGKSEFCNGQVGTYGLSANGITQLLLAPTRPENLKCQFIQVATPSLYTHAAYVGGKLCKHQVENWFAQIAPKAYEKILANQSYSQYWEQIDCAKKAEYVKTPALHVGGWYDIFSQGTLDAFDAWQNKGDHGARGKQKLIMGPWTHWGSSQEKFGEYAFPEASLEFQEQSLLKKWFDFHLKGDKNAIEEMPAVTYYVMGPLDNTPSMGNCWKSSDSWPPNANYQTHYLNKSRSLTAKKPLFSSKKFSFYHDPSNPVPTIGGRNLYLESGPFNQNKNESRKDVVTFTSDTLTKDTEVTGRISAKIYLSSSAPSADLAISLCDVYPNGKSVLISEGIKQVTLTENHVQLVEVDLWSTSMVFAKDHKIRVNIAGSNYPHFDKNELPSENVIHVGFKYPSHITLPVVD